MDFVSIAVTLAMAVGLLGADAALSANTLTVHMRAPSFAFTPAIDREFAEELFATEISRMVETPSLLHPPTVRSSTEHSVVSVVAKSLGLDDLTLAVQQQIGLEPVRLTGMFVPGDQKRLVMTAPVSQTGPFTIDVTTENNDEVALIRRAAHLAMERVEPYRAALFQFTHAVEEKSTDFTVPRTIAERELDHPVNAKKQRDRRALYMNLLGVIALMRNDVAEADRHFTALVDEHPDSAIGHLNLGFLRIHQDRYDDAIRAVEPMLRPKRLTKIKEVLCSAYITLGVAAWAKGDLHGADAMFARATREHPGTSAGYDYWATLLAEMGRPTESAEKKRIAILNLPNFENYPEVAMLYFQLSPRDRTPLIRR